MNNLKTELNEVQKERELYETQHRKNEKNRLKALQVGVFFWISQICIFHSSYIYLPFFPPEDEHGPKLVEIFYYC